MNVITLIPFTFFAQYMDVVQGSICIYDVFNCRRAQIMCNEQEKILLMSKNNLDGEHCLAIKHHEYEDLRNYEIGVDMLSLESNEGINTGNLGIIFNFVDPMNYDFVYLE